MVEVLVENFALETAAQKIGPEKFTEWRRILGEAAGATQFAGQRPEWIVDQITPSAS
jgi:truncated hemoglobin YjbI